MTRAVGFDLGDTLIEYEGVALSWEREYPIAVAAVGSLWCESLSDSQMSRGAAVLRRYNTRLTPRVHEVDHVTVFTDVLGAMGAPPGRLSSLIEPAADAFFAVFQRHARGFPDSRRVIDTLLRRGIGVGVLTVVPYGMPRRLVSVDLESSGLGALEGAMLTSTEVGKRKPDPLGFVALAASLGCAPEQMSFVGNEQKDMSGALEAGMRAILVWRNGDARYSSLGARCVGLKSG